MIARAIVFAFVCFNSAVYGLNDGIKRAIARLGCRVHDTAPSSFKSREHVILNIRSGSKNEPRGLMTRCDWTFTWDYDFYGIVDEPKTVCVQTRALSIVWKFLAEEMQQPFILVAGGGDQTTPLGTGDTHGVYKNFGSPDGGVAFKALVNSSKMMHWFSENHDMNHSKLSTIPTAFTENPNENPTLLMNAVLAFKKNLPNIIVPLTARDTKVPIIVMDRVRTGEGQWLDRNNSHNWCRKASFCQTSDQLPNITVGHGDFMSVISGYQFVLCTHGGGIDPSPKAWESILLGTIPIIEHSTLDDAYIKLPVVILPSFADFFNQDEAIIRKMLAQWLVDLSPYYVKGPLRVQTLYRLTTDYWWNIIMAKYYTELSLYSIAVNGRLDAAFFERRRNLRSIR
jgi:hypothetical protein